MLFSLASVGLAGLAQGLIQYRENGLDYGKCGRKSNCKAPRSQTTEDNKVWTQLYNDQRSEEDRWCYCDADAPARGDYCADYEKTCDKQFSFADCKAKYCVDENGDAFDGQEMKACQTTFCKSIFDMQRDNRNINRGVEGADGEYWDASDKDREMCEIEFCGGLQADQFTKCQNSFCNLNFNPTFPGTTETTIMNNQLKCMFASYTGARVLCNDVEEGGAPQGNADLIRSRGVDKYWRKWTATTLGRTVKRECIAAANSGQSLEISECMDLYGKNVKMLGRLDARRVKNKGRGHCKQVLFDYFYDCINNNFNTRQCQNYRDLSPRYLPNGQVDPDFVIPAQEQYSSCAPQFQNTCAEMHLVSDEAWDAALACTEDPPLNDESNDACMCPKGYYRQNHHQNGKCVLPENCRVLEGYTPGSTGN